MEDSDSSQTPAAGDIRPAEENVIEEPPHRRLLGGEFWRSIPAYRDIPERLFNDPNWQLRNSVTSVAELLQTIRGSVDEAFLHDASEGFRRAPMAVRVTPYLISLMSWDDPYGDPLRRQYIPLLSEQRRDHPELVLDSLHEQVHSPTPGLIHRYPDKVLLLALDHCPVYCRYCTRSYAVGLDTPVVEKRKLGQGKERLLAAFAYIGARPEIEDVVISGGDTAMLRPDRIRWIGESLLRIEHIRRIRYATKAPAILPQKLLNDHEWYGALLEVHRLGRQTHKEVCVHTHFSHPNEITEISKKAMNRLMEEGVTVRNQAVLQRGVNDSAGTMIQLARRLAFVNVQPYYVYMHDLVKGVEDLRTTLDAAIRIEKQVRGTTAGFNTPNFVVDLPEGGGKRSVHSYEHYDRETGISVFVSPAIGGERPYLYFDPVEHLSPVVRQAWRRKWSRREMKEAALSAAGGLALVRAALP